MADWTPPLKGDLAGRWAVWVDANWRLVFMFDGVDVVGVDYLDYHGCTCRSPMTCGVRRSAGGRAFVRYPCRDFRADLSIWQSDSRC